MKPMNTRGTAFRRILGGALLGLALLGATSLCMKEIPLALFGERATGTVRKVEVIQTSTSTKWERNGFGPKQAVSRGGYTTQMHMAFTTKEGKPMEVKTTATFNTEAKVGDQHPMVYLASKPETAKIYSARQLWLPMCVGFVFTGVCTFLGLLLVRRPAGAVASQGPMQAVEIH